MCGSHSRERPEKCLLAPAEADGQMVGAHRAR